MYVSIYTLHLFSTRGNELPKKLYALLAAYSVRLKYDIFLYIR